MNAKEILEAAAMGFTALIAMTIVWNVILGMLYSAGKKIRKVKHKDKIKNRIKGVDYDYDKVLDIN